VFEPPHDELKFDLFLTLNKKLLRRQKCFKLTCTQIKESSFATKFQKKLSKTEKYITKNPEKLLVEICSKWYQIMQP